MLDAHRRGDLVDVLPAWAPGTARRDDEIVAIDRCVAGAVVLGLEDADRGEPSLPGRAPALLAPMNELVAPLLGPELARQVASNAHGHGPWRRLAPLTGDVADREPVAFRESLEPVRELVDEASCFDGTDPGADLENVLVHDRHLDGPTNRKTQATTAARVLPPIRSEWFGMNHRWWFIENQ